MWLAEAKCDHKVGHVIGFFIKFSRMDESQIWLLSAGWVNSDICLHFSRRETICSKKSISCFCFFFWAKRGILRRDSPAPGIHSHHHHSNIPTLSSFIPSSPEILVWFIASVNPAVTKCNFRPGFPLHHTLFIQTYTCLVLTAVHQGVRQSYHVFVIAILKQFSKFIHIFFKLLYAHCSVLFIILPFLCMYHYAWQDSWLYSRLIFCRIKGNEWNPSSSHAFSHWTNQVDTGFTVSEWGVLWLLPTAKLKSVGCDSAWEVRVCVCV